VGRLTQLAADGALKGYHMVRRLPCLLAFFFTCGLTLAGTFEEIAEKAAPAVVQIITYDITGERIGQGSGFFVSPQEVVTNEHVVAGAYSAEVLSTEGLYEKVTVLNTNDAMDLAILRLPAKSNVALQLKAGGELKPGQRVLTIGNPLGLESTASDGLIAAVRKIGPLQVLQITAPISPGSSGGPVLDEDGYVVGVVSATVREGQNLNFAVGVETLKSFLAMEQRPEELKVAGSRVLWRVVTRWIVRTVVMILALALGGGWWVLAIAIMILIGLWYAIAWICKNTYRLLMHPFKEKPLSHATALGDSDSSEVALPGANFSDRDAEDEGEYGYEDEDGEEEEEEDDDDDADDDEDEAAYALYCWRCGEKNYYDPDDMEISCWHCKSSLPIPDDLRE
jgi:hypothetical protein